MAIEMRRKIAWLEVNRSYVDNPPAFAGGLLILSSFHESIFCKDNRLLNLEIYLKNFENST